MIIVNILIMITILITCMNNTIDHTNYNLS